MNSSLPGRMNWLSLKDWWPFREAFLLSYYGWSLDSAFTNELIIIGRLSWLLSYL